MKIYKPALDLVTLLLGDNRQFSLEQRLFNAMTLLNGITNLMGCIGILFTTGNMILVSIQLLFGVAFLSLYGLSRKCPQRPPSFWMFVVLIIIFISINIVYTQGSSGGTLFYLIAGMIIASVISPNWTQTLLATSLFILAVLFVAVIEIYTPELLVPYASEQERMTDVYGQLSFVIALTSALVMVLKAELLKERARFDSLLKSILPEVVADEFVKTGQVTARHSDSATVLYLDLPDFDSSAENLSPSELTIQVDSYFSRFDDIGERWGLDRVKTLGGRYLSAANLTRPTVSHARSALSAAADMLAETEKINRERLSQAQSPWRIRIGVHTGPIYSGMTGASRKAFDIWGNTVQVAAELMTQAPTESIYLSRQTAEASHLKSGFRDVGRVPLARHGEVDVLQLTTSSTPEFESVPYLTLKVSANANALHFAPAEGMNPGLPPTAELCEVYSFSGDQPPLTEHMNWVATVKQSPYLVVPDRNADSTQVYYAIRWLNKDGTKSAFSPLVSAFN